MLERTEMTSNYSIEAFQSGFIESILSKNIQYKTRINKTKNKYSKCDHN